MKYCTATCMTPLPPGQSRAKRIMCPETVRKTNPVGKIVQIDLADGGIRYEDETTPLSRPFQIAAVLKEHSQSYLKFDMLTGIGQDYYGGGVALLKVSPRSTKNNSPKRSKQTESLPCNRRKGDTISIPCKNPISNTIRRNRFLISPVPSNRCYSSG